MNEIPPSELPGEETPTAEGIERIISLSSSVFGFSLTLLAVSISVPALPAARAAEGLPEVILALWPKVAIFALSFFTVSTFWLAYQRIFRFILRYDNRLQWLNQLFLLFIAFMPIPTALIGLYPLEQPAIILFSGNLFLTGLTGIAIWHYATSGRRLTAPDLSPRVVRYLYLRYGVYAGIYLLAIALSFVEPFLDFVLWALAAALTVSLTPISRRLLALLERKLGRGPR